MPAGKARFAACSKAALAAMERLGAKRARIAAAIGPCIRQANYEVGRNSRRASAPPMPANARFFVPVARAPAITGSICRLCRPPPRRTPASDQVETLGACTYARENDFFSFRRTTHRKEPDYGREISAIVLDEVSTALQTPDSQQPSVYAPGHALLKARHQTRHRRIVDAGDEDQGTR